jgi:hypothetical protein
MADQTVEPSHPALVKAFPTDFFHPTHQAQMQTLPVLIFTDLLLLWSCTS